MNTWFLSLALAVGCAACAVEAAPRTLRSAGDDAADPDDFVQSDDDDPPPAARADAGTRRDAGTSSRRDAGTSSRRDAGVGVDSGTKQRDAGPILCVDGGMSADGDGPDSADPIGAGCRSDGDCGDGAKCLTEVMLPFGGVRLTYPGGYCTRSCSSDAVCGDGASCPLAAAGAAAADFSNCMQNCASAGDCRDGYSCGSVPSLGGAAPANPQKICLPPSPFGAGGLPAP